MRPSTLSRPSTCQSQNRSGGGGGNIQNLGDLWNEKSPPPPPIDYISSLLLSRSLSLSVSRARSLSLYFSSFSLSLSTPHHFHNSSMVLILTSAAKIEPPSTVASIRRKQSRWKWRGQIQTIFNLGFTLVRKRSEKYRYYSRIYQDILYFGDHRKALDMRVVYKFIIWYVAMRNQNKDVSGRSRPHHHAYHIGL